MESIKGGIKDTIKNLPYDMLYEYVQFDYIYLTGMVLCFTTLMLAVFYQDKAFTKFFRRQLYASDIFTFAFKFGIAFFFFLLCSFLWWVILPLCLLVFSLRMFIFYFKKITGMNNNDDDDDDDDDDDNYRYNNKKHDRRRRY
jgi:hypothetical protein